MRRRLRHAAVVIAALAGGVALAQPSHQREVKFGDEAVTPKFNSAPLDEELYRLWDATAEATDPVEQERLWRIRWEDYGESARTGGQAGSSTRPQQRELLQMAMTETPPARRQAGAPGRS